MQFSTFLIATMALFGTTGLACQCHDNGSSNPDDAATDSCCISRGIDPVPKNSKGQSDCPADAISEHLSNFSACCSGKETFSDCPFPGKFAIRGSPGEKNASGNRRDESVSEIVVPRWWTERLRIYQQRGVEARWGTVKVKAKGRAASTILTVHGR
ncbi:hypothetical protein K504DRAFT_500163 [Pleomassaria siparia CBS 279.74]|uniref:Uncharacterized protein n=1 Tax=Pleomassaria siparia CBS 279.74 TaxID=1314801 RepID=A0A6G1KF91_9PLEO|nr:hypothetical protein K504DRAFT_500163 [Pleomassaria siparia CBS 279.74]